ncbi:hypothetical protein GEY59_13550 [Salmonella enterica subsp. enterica serovar Mikawasima]|uniref:Uncharacterized protein n=1 Tax=Salmonella enterica subsp. enterica serovar Mikawasima TaxID=149388 RepID=A0A5H9F3L1_SALET|nr:MULTISPECIES: hypothetical protein [Salmonella]EAA1179186.1 hypothetical protein [Salmonella enterica subsp. enterica serovar Mikawasima]EAC0557643.1 hypothetical protein [Salmonella enterica subsp. enterica serovar Richmond]EBP4006475.1 hypothetical protein [Salmonella enterica subsp. enterica]EDG9410295.1 hypothetical protein [Salmonella enterica subsp. enterica serovar Tennessee]EHG1406511.1 hypothetical protein [Salmonella enterica subsp. enterica serovar Bareilly]
MAHDVTRVTGKERSLKVTPGQICHLVSPEKLQV